MFSKFRESRFVKRITTNLNSSNSNQAQASDVAAQPAAVEPRKQPRIEQIQLEEKNMKADEGIVPASQLAALNLDSPHARLVQEFSLLMNCYRPLHQRLSNLEQTYCQISSKQGRLDQVRFISSVLSRLSAPSYFSLAGKMEAEAKDKVIALESDYYALVGACLYIYEQIGEQCKSSSWTFQFWGASPQNSALWQLLKEEVVDNVDLATKQKAISQLHILLLDPDNQQQIQLPNDSSGKPQSYDQFKETCLGYLTAYCPEVAKPAATLAF